MTTKEIPEIIARDVTAYKCSCGGFCDRVEPTEAEEEKYGCGRPNCCAAAFVCAICGTRWVGSRKAPEME